MDKSNIKLAEARMFISDERIEVGKVETVDVTAFPKDGINTSKEITLSFKESIAEPKKLVGYMTIDPETGKTYHLKKEMKEQFDINKRRFGK